MTARETGAGRQGAPAAPDVTHTLVVCGLGLLLAAFVGAIGRAGSANTAETVNAAQAGLFQGSFFISSAIGLAIVGALHLVCRLTRRLLPQLFPRLLPQLYPQATRCDASTAQPRVPAGRSADMLPLLLGTALIVAGSVLGATPGSLSALPLGIDVAGLMFGAGCMAMSVRWARTLARVPYIEVLRMGAQSLAVGSAVGAATVVVLPIPLVCALWALASACCQLLVWDRLPSPREEADPGRVPAEHAAAPQGRVALLVRTAWAPICGLSICSFLLGVLWLQSAPGAVVELASTSVEASSLGTAGSSPRLDFIGPLAVSAILIAVARRVRNQDGARRLFWATMPLVACLFLITPHLDSALNPVLDIVVVNLQNGGSAALLYCSWALLLLAARTTALDVGAVFGCCLGLPAAAVVGGFLAHAGLGTVANTLALVLFDLYACAAVAFLALAGPAGEEARAAEGNLMASYVGTRCAGLADRCGLTAREAEILAFLGRGHSYAHIAENIYVSEATVRSHARNIYRKLGVTSQEDLLNLIDAPQ